MLRHEFVFVEWHKMKCDNMITAKLNLTFTKSWWSMSQAISPWEINWLKKKKKI